MYTFPYLYKVPTEEFAGIEELISGSNLELLILFLPNDEIIAGFS